MRGREARRGALRAGALVAFLVWLAPAVAQEEAANQAPTRPAIVVSPEGTEIFRHWVFDAGYAPLRSWQEAVDQPQQTLVIALGNLSDLQRGELANFIDRGGAVLLATDSHYVDFFLGFAITGEFVSTPPGPDSYRKEPHCPVVRPIANAARHSPARIFQNLMPPADPVATNNPSVLRVNPNVLRVFDKRARETWVLAGYPNSATFHDGRDLDPEADFFALAGFGRQRSAGTRGRFLALADHSVFINRMMGQNDNSNVEFARNCLEWLQQTGAAPRTHCLFLEDGSAQTQFALPTPEQPMPPLDVLINTFLQHGNNLVAELQGRDAFNGVLLSNFGLSAIVRTILLGLTALLLVVGLLRLWSARTGPDPAAQLTAQAAPLIPRGSAVRQRHAAQLEQGNLYELARQRVRDQFQFLDDVDWSVYERPPNVVVEWHVPDRRRLRKQVERFWQIGYGSKPVRVPRREWDTFDADLDNVVRAAQDGWWRFEPPSGTTG
jgi:Domain of unknown function (DUF4350)